MRRGLLLGVIAAVLLTAGWWFLLISPRNAKIDDAHQALESARDEEALLRTRIRSLEEIRDSEVEYLAALGKMETMIPERPMLEEFIDQINALADSTGILLRSLSPSVPEPSIDGSELREIAVNVQADGQFFDAVGFMFGLLELDRLVRVDGIAVTSAADEAGETILSMSLQLKLFTLADLVAVPESGGVEPGGESPDAGDQDEDPAEAGGTSEGDSAAPTTTTILNDAGG
jgi:Tfp pilus assembly protein PilO